MESVIHCHSTGGSKRGIDRGWLELSKMIRVRVHLLLFITIPLNPKLRHDIVESFHDHETAGHLGELETYNAVWQHYWWPGLRNFTKNYVQGCGICQQFKINQSPSKPAFMPTKGSKSTRPFSNCSMDLIIDLPLAEGFNSILDVVDQGLMKGVILIACNKNITAKGTARLLLENLYKWFGLPDKFILDRGPQFASKNSLTSQALVGSFHNPIVVDDGDSDNDTARPVDNTRCSQCQRYIYNSFHSEDYCDTIFIPGASAMVCRLCGLHGHLMLDCREIVCTWCDRLGHIIDNCPNLDWTFLNLGFSKIVRVVLWFHLHTYNLLTLFLYFYLQNNMLQTHVLLIFTIPHA